MTVIQIPISELRKPDRNVRLHSNKQIAEFKRSVEMFGQIRPIVVDENNVILAGNGLFEALAALGREMADCYVVHGLTETQKKKLMLADNRIFSLGVDDMQAFDEIVAELGSDFDIPGYDPDLLKTLTIDLGGADDLMAGYGVISDATKAEMQSAADVYEREGAEFAEGAVEVTPQRPIATIGTPSSAFSPPGNIGVAQAKEPLESSPEPLERRFMICPKCGERIWL